MQIQTVIDKIKAYHNPNVTLDIATTRDQVLYGEDRLGETCTGVVVTMWATADAIRRARALGANLIISHESLFWNHGDDTRWLERSENATYAAKKALLDEAGIVVWRDHDHLHAGIPVGRLAITLMGLCGGWRRR